jgi:hypothetical protein
VLKEIIITAKPKISDKNKGIMDRVFDAIPNLSVISQIELLCWKTEATTEQKIKDFISDSVVMDINPEAITHCVNIREGKK